MARMTSSRLLVVGWALLAGLFTLDCGGDDDATPPQPLPDGSAGTSSAGDTGVDAAGGSAGSTGGASATGGASGSAGGSGTGGGRDSGADSGSDAGTAPPECVKTCR